MNTYEKTNLSYDSSIPVAMENAESRAGFYKKTYTHVALAFLAFVLVEGFLFASGLAEVIGGFLFASKWMLIGVMIGFAFASSYVQNIAYSATEKKNQYLALGLYILLQAVIFIPLIFMAFSYAGAGALTNILIPAVLITTALFAGLILTVFITGKDFSFLKAGISIGFMIMFGIAIVGMIAGFNIGSWFSIGMIVLMAGAILYQTSQVQHAYHKEQYVAASVAIFASFMTLLFYVIRLLSSRD
jgi:FtsH-binding integral membrane protein